jgi:hypothetical protein
MLQWALAEGLADDAMMDGQVRAWAASRAVLNEGLAQAGFAVLPNVATWFSCVDLARSGIELDDDFAERAAEAGGDNPALRAVGRPDAPRQIVRLCHCKPAAMLEEAVRRLADFHQA